MSSKTKDNLKSKKFILATAAIGASFLVWAISFVGVLLNPAAAAHIVTLATLIITLMGAVAGAGITGQSFVDWKHGSTTAETYETKREDTTLREERIYRAEKLDSKDLDPEAHDPSIH